VFYAPKLDRQIHIGKIIGDYRYDPRVNGYPNLRSVKWLRTASRYDFSDSALRRMDTPSSLFKIKDPADEFRAMAQEKVPTLPTKEEPRVRSVQNDLTKPGVSGELKFEHFTLETQDAALSRASETAYVDHEFEPTNLAAAVEKAMREVAVRLGQRTFRKTLMDAYDSKCAISGFGFAEVLEAAPIHPYCVGARERMILQMAYC
jgi:predicted Mrr-cat superfamily restriction endonuclease